RHLLSLTELGEDGIADILRLTDRFAEVTRRRIPKVPALRGRTVCTLFFENSTRTKLSFESAAKRLSADTMSFSPGGSSVAKGESIRDTVETLEAMGVDAFVVRHGSSGVPWQIRNWVAPTVSVINAGDGWHSHPTQGLLDAYTLWRTLGTGSDDQPDLAGVNIGLIGDIRHSRVARSDVAAFTALGARVTLVAPPTLLPPSLEGWPVDVSHDLDSVIPELDVVALLRIQRERMVEALIPSLLEYTNRYGLTAARAARLRPDAVVMHPGPVNRGIEIDSDVLDTHPGAVVTRQVANGVAVRMAVLFMLLGSEVADPAHLDGEESR
ncbi:MAG TPA: aspartate carbamoyltransferase catalytic subunit, partial [Acidimicrobiales bacterium]|nr:aspartate carbamoyltransferase catalytic subunit [Acidimicrobiales bacterium]